MIRFIKNLFIFYPIRLKTLELREYELTKEVEGLKWELNLVRRKVYEIISAKNIEVPNGK
jgi:hypothetical protein